MPCLANACHQGRAACPAPMTCSGAAPLVEESLQFWQLHRLQEVRSVDERWDAPRASAYLTRPLASDVFQGPQEPDDFIKQENALTAGLRWFLLPLIVCGALVGSAIYICRLAGWY